MNTKKEHENSKPDDIFQLEGYEEAIHHSPKDNASFSNNNQTDDHKTHHDSTVHQDHNSSPTNHDSAVQQAQYFGPYFGINKPFPSDNARPIRSNAQLVRYQDYEVNLPPSIDYASPAANHVASLVHPLSNYISYQKNSTSCKAFLAVIVTHDVPRSFKHAIHDPKWHDAMKKEIKALEDNDTWELVMLPEGKRAIESKWI